MNYRSADCSTFRKSYIRWKSPSQLGIEYFCWQKRTIHCPRLSLCFSALWDCLHKSILFTQVNIRTIQCMLWETNQTFQRHTRLFTGFPYSREPPLNIATSMFNKMRFPLWERNRRQSEKARYSRRGKTDQDSFNPNNGENWLQIDVH